MLKREIQFINDIKYKEKHNVSKANKKELSDDIKGIIKLDKTDI